MKQELVKVEGMTCQHCVKTITEALNKISGVDLVDVNLHKKEVDVRFNENEISLQKIKNKIIEMGFELPKN